MKSIKACLITATNEFVKQMRLFAHRLQEAAEYAGTQAQEAEHEIPHDMIKQRYSVRRRFTSLADGASMWVYQTADRTAIAAPTIRAFVEP